MNQAASLEDLVNGSRALDRIFIAEHFAVPFLYRPYRMVAYWDRFGIPAVMPKYFSIDYFQMQDGLGGMPWPIATWWTKK
jgi:ABC-type oligopeptide transport system substrate-binding subunit